MSKESLPLEALEKVKFYAGDTWVNSIEWNIIETALIDYEKKTKLAKEYEDVSKVAKRLKALEIIKEKGLFWSIEWQPFEKENDYRAWDNELYESKKLTKEEYDLLKEVLL